MSQGSSSPSRTTVTCTPGFREGQTHFFQEHVDKFQEAVTGPPHPRLTFFSLHGAPNLGHSVSCTEVLKNCGVRA